MPAVLDRWTSGSDGAVRQVTFMPGGTLQYHAVVQGDPADPNQRIRIGFIIESVFNFTAMDDSSMELVFRPQLALDGVFTVSGDPAHAFLSIETIPAGPARPRGSREDVVHTLSTGGGGTIFTPALYTYRVYVSELDAPGRPLVVSEPWYYEIGS